MKSFIILAAIAATGADWVFAQDASRPQGAANPPVMRDASTHEELAAAYQKAQREDPLAKLKQIKGSDPTVVNQPKNIISESDILCFNGMWTIIPKGAIMMKPKNFEDRLKFAKGSKLVSWADFYALNRGWISTIEVSRSQAEGNQVLETKVADQIAKSTNLVVATYQNCPISVLPPKEKVIKDDPAKHDVKKEVSKTQTLKP